VAIRALISDLMPPILFRAAQKQWHRMQGTEHFVFEGSYPSLGSILCADNSYDDATLAERFVASKLPKFKIEPTGWKITDNNGNWILPLVAACYREQFTVLDFGCGPCVGLDNILTFCGRDIASRLTYIAVDTAAMSDAIRKDLVPVLNGRFTGLRIAEGIPAAVDGPLIAHLGGSLQYVTSYGETLAKIINLAPEHIIIAQTPMTDAGPSYARRQLNMAPKELACWVFSRDEIVSTMSAAGYDKVFLVQHDLNVPHKNAPGPSEFTSIVFTRR
jgi:putative methyltransferase (TIGR04325 family)